MLQRLTSLWTLLAVVAGQNHSEALNLYRNTFNGTATYYDDGGWGGTCSYGSHSLPPVSSQVRYSAALNQPQYLGSLMCGSCWKVTGSGSGSGNNPVTGTFTVFVDDLCPKCHAGSVDLGVPGDGRWQISIQAVQCPVGDGKISFVYRGSNPFLFLHLQVQNQRLPVHVMEVEHNGSWHRGNRTGDGFFLFQNGLYNGSLRVRLTAINGAQVIDHINFLQNDEVIQGTQQFPHDGSLPG